MSERGGGVRDRGRGGGEKERREGNPIISYKGPYIIDMYTVCI